MLWAADSAAEALVVAGGRSGVETRKCGYYSMAKAEEFPATGLVPPSLNGKRRGPTVTAPFKPFTRAGVPP